MAGHQHRRLATGGESGQPLQPDHLHPAAAGRQTVHQRELGEGTADPVPVFHRDTVPSGWREFGEGQLEIAQHDPVAMGQGPQPLQQCAAEPGRNVHRQASQQKRNRIIADRLEPPSRASQKCRGPVAHRR